MTPLFIKSIGSFLRQTKEWWIGLAVLVALIAIIWFMVWLIVIGQGAWLFLIFIPIILSIMIADL